MMNVGLHTLNPHNNIEQETNTCWVCVDIVQTGKCLRETPGNPCPFYHPSAKQIDILKRKQVVAPPEATAHPIPEKTLVSVSCISKHKSSRENCEWYHASKSLI